MLTTLRGRLAMAAVLFAVDQATKLWASAALDYGSPVVLLPMLNLMLVHNEGAAFSMLAGAGGWQRWLFAGLSAAISLALLYWLRRVPAAQRGLGLALALLLAGALGNLVDRLRFGHVVDFIDFHVGAWHWPAFNVADCAITVGALLLLLDGLLVKQSRAAE